MRLLIKPQILAAIFISLMAVSCSYDESDWTDVQTDEANVIISTRSDLYPDDADKKISTLRIIAFTVGGGVQSNELYTSAKLASIISHKMRTGTYTFVFIANEPSGIAASLNSLKRYSDLGSIRLPASAFNSDTNIPMVYERADVEILKENKVKVGGVTYTTWSIAPVRLAVRMDIVLTADIDMSDEFSGIRFENIPDYVPLMPDNANYNGTRNTSRELKKSVSADSKYFKTPTTTELGGKAWGVKVERVIIPSNVFTPVSNTTSAVKLSVLRTSNHTTTNTIGYNESGDNYTLPRNTSFTIKGNIVTPILLNIKAKDWEPVNIDADIENRTLNLSNINPTIHALSPLTIDFWSNQPDVTVETVGYTGSSGTTTYTVSTIFKELTDDSARNFQYTYTSSTRSGKGSLTLNTDRLTAGTYRIILNANGLRKEIKVVITACPLTIAEWSSQPYIGTFHRYNQKGERVIAGKNTGSWTATVENDTQNFVVLSASRSLDPTLWASSPDDPENYPITDGVKTISGTGNIFFRVGLTKTLTSATSAPRYARIKVTYAGGTKTSYIYVRQGEEPDYVFRKTDPYTNTAGGSGTTRPPAGKFAVFNLIDPKKGTGSSIFASHNTVTVNDATFNSAKFTQYPTQGGHLFQFNRNRAFSPTYPLGSITNWDVFENDVTPFQTAKETCPYGYRHPNSDGNWSIHNVQSELEYSLFETIDIVGTFGDYRLTNTVWGFYADGFFDRRPVKTYSTVGSGAEAAFIGRIFYNPTTWASLFFPAAGARFHVTNGATNSNLVSQYSAGYYGSYWTTYTLSRSSLGDLNESSAAECLNVSNGEKAAGNTHLPFNKPHSKPKADAASIRCVKK